MESADSDARRAPALRVDIATCRQCGGALRTGRRTVQLPAELVNELRKRKLASPYKEAGDLVFATSRVKPHSHGNLNRRGWKPPLRGAGLPGRKFHRLRHTFESAVIRNYVSMKVVSTLCGHSSISITMNVYSYLLPDSTEGIADALAGALLGAGGRKVVAAGLE
jgi:integrase